MKWLLLIKWLVLCSIAQAATVRVYNKSDQLIKVKITGGDLAQEVGAGLNMVVTGGSRGNYQP